MIIGNGDLAEALRSIDRPDITFLASGVSNSSSVSYADHLREQRMIRQHHLNHVVYFSSLCIYEKETPYTLHKLSIEKLIRSICNKYTIIRLGNITWGNNPNTIINYFRNCKEQPELRDEYKYICTLDEFQYWIGKIPDFNTEMNITGERVHVRVLYDRIRRESFSQIEDMR